MFVAEKVLLLLVISLTVHCQHNYDIPSAGDSHLWDHGPHLNIKIMFPCIRISHHKDKTLMIGLNLFNTLRPRQNGRHFADYIFKRIFFNENVCISIEISLKFVPKGPIDNIPALVQIMAWHRPGAKPLSEPMMVRLPTLMRHSASMS